MLPVAENDLSSLLREEGMAVALTEFLAKNNLSRPAKLMPVCRSLVDDIINIMLKDEANSDVDCNKIAQTLHTCLTWSLPQLASWTRAASLMLKIWMNTNTLLDIANEVLPVAAGKEAADFISALLTFRAITMVSRTCGSGFVSLLINQYITLPLLNSFMDT